MSVIYLNRQYKKGALPVKLLTGPNNIYIEVSGEPDKEILPNRYYMFGEMKELNITLATPRSEEILQEYMFEFISGNIPTVLNLPETVKWVTSDLIEANKTYQVSIVNNLAVMGGA